VHTERLDDRSFSLDSNPSFDSFPDFDRTHSPKHDEGRAILFVIDCFSFERVAGL